MKDIELEFRKLTKCDAPQIQLLSDFARTNIRRDFLTAYMDETVDAIYDEKKYSHFVAVHGDAIAGILRYINDQDSLEYDRGVLRVKDSQKICKVGGLVVLPEFQHQGIAQKLFRMSFDEAAKDNCELAIGRVSPQNAPSINAVTRAGFKESIIAPGESGMVKRYYVKEIEKEHDSTSASK